MTLAEEVREKALQLKQDFDDVKEAGYAEGYPKGVVDGEADGYNKGKTDGYNEGYADGLANGGGGSQAVDLFPYMKIVQFDSAFSEITEPQVFHLEQVISLNQTFYNSRLFCPKITLYISDKCTNLQHTFRYGHIDTVSTIEEIEIIGDTSKITTYNQAFNYRQSIKRILGAFDFSSCTVANSTTAMFGNCTSLQEFYPVANTIKVAISFANSPNLIPACKQAIINGLADLTGQTTQTITFHKDVVLSEEQKATITLKNWTLVQ